jgi:hypothetical protein
MQETKAHFPLSQWLPFWPAGSFSEPNLGEIAIVNYESSEQNEAATFTLTIAYTEEIALDIPGVEGMQLVLLGQSGWTYLTVEAIFSEFFELRFIDLALTLRFASEFIQPVEGSAEHGWTPKKDIDDVVLPLELSFIIPDLVVDGQGRIYPEGVPSLSLPAVMIGETGIVVEADEVEIYLSGNEIPPDGQTPGFRGIALDSVTLYLPEAFQLGGITPETIEASDVVIGNSGLSGTFTGSWIPSWVGNTVIGDGAGTLAGMAFGLESLSIRISQNAIAENKLTGTILLPFFDEPLTIALSLTNDGGFHAALGQTDEDGLLELPIPGLGTLTLSSIGIVDDEQGTAVLLSGTLQLTVLSPPLQWPAIELQELRIDADGNVQLPNGWIDLQEPAGFSLFGFGFELTRIGFGNMKDGRRWVGFSGGVQLLPMLPTGASVEGLRIIWDPDNPNAEPQITLQGVGVELTLPGVIQFDGDVALITEGDERYFQGNAGLDIIPIGIGIDASLKIGRNLVEDYKYLYTYMDLNLPIGIPLFATGAAIYGFAGLYGMNVGPSAQNSDWYGWYASSPAFNVTDSTKWMGEHDGKSLGAGLTIGTLFDAGRVVSAKGLFALILPGPVIILHGMANFLDELPDISDSESQGVFNMLAVIDMLTGSIQLNIDAGWRKANLLDIAASAEAYFDFANPANWHFHLGKDEPADRRIRAYMLSLFQADAYLMIDRDGIATGASISWGMDWKFGPVKVVLRSWIGGDAAITWQPTQLAGRLYVGGEFEVSVAGFGVGIGAEAELSGATPTAYCVRGTLYLRVKLPTPIKDLEEDILLEWKEEKIPGSDDPFQSIGIEHMKADETWTKLGTDTEQSSMPLSDENSGPIPIVPLDARPSVVFDRPMKDDTTGIELNNPDGYDSGYKSTDIDGHLFDYILTDVTLDKWSKAGGTRWVPVEDLYGTWIAMEDANGELAAGKFQLWTTSPFAFTRQSSRTYTDKFLATHALWPCAMESELETHCVDWEDDIDTGTAFGQSFEWKGLYFTVVLSNSAEVVNSSDMPGCQNTNALKLPGSYVVLWIVFPEPVRNVDICIGRDFIAVKAISNGAVLEQILDPEAGKLSLESTNIDTIALWSLDDGEVGSICYQIESEASSHDSTLEYMDRVVASLQRWDSREEILEPETWYRLTVEQETVRTHNGVTYPTPISHYAYFQTAGPPGLTPPWALTGVPATGDNAILPYPQGGKLTDLQPYITWTIPGDGDQPVYRAYDLGADFNENYVEQMYGADMAIRLLDGNGKPVTDAEGNEVIFPNLWADQPTGELSETEIPYTTRIEDCLGLPPTAVLGDQKILFANGVLLEEDFSGDLDQWTDPNAEETGEWAIDRDILVYTGTLFPTLGALLVAGETAWTDYALEVTLSDQGEEVGLVFRYMSADNGSYYRLRLKATERLFEKVIDGTITVLWQDNTGYVPGENEVLGVQSQGDRLRGQLDGELLFDLRDEAPLVTGQVGIYTNSTAGFEHFLVREWPGGVLSPLTMYRAELMGSFVLFNEGLSGGWVDNTLSWGELEKDRARIASIGREDWDNYRLEVNMDSSRGHVGAIVRFLQHPDGQNPDEGTFACYRLIINPDTQILKLALLQGTYDGNTYEVDEDGRTVLWSCEGDVCDFDFQLHTHDVALTCEGNTLTVEIDGQEFIRIDDDNNALTNGQAGIYYLGDEDPSASDLGFSELVIRSAPRQPVHQWNFTTSQFPGLVEHLDTFTGTVYAELADHTDAQALSVAVDAAAVDMDAARQQLDTSRSELTGASPDDLARKRDGAQSASRKVNDAAAEHFDLMYQLFFPNTYRPLPPVAELSEILSGQNRLALLLESPEPFNWSRITVTVSRFRLRRGEFVELNDVLIVWSEDGTRAILTRTGSTLLLPGQYRILVHQDLDIGLEAPLLRRGGSVLPELAELQFQLSVSIPNP